MSFHEIINFNSEASCLSHDRWLAALVGGKNSELCCWLSLYVQEKNPICLGLMGVTILDVLALNPEAIELINNNPGIFKLALRPYSHCLLSTFPDDFVQRQIEVGYQIVRSVFSSKIDCFLPPEFSMSVAVLNACVDLDIFHVFFSGQRLSSPTHENLSTEFKDRIIFFDHCDESYFREFLKVSQRFSDFSILPTSQNFWRDGESFLLVPNGIQREKFALDRRGQQFTAYKEFPNPADYKKKNFYYPKANVSTWHGSGTADNFHKKIVDLWHSGQSTDLLYFSFLSYISGSDILASLEKRDVTVLIKDDKNEWDHIIKRQDKFQKADFILNALINGEDPSKCCDQEIFDLLLERSKMLSKIL